MKREDFTTEVTEESRGSGERAVTKRWVVKDRLRGQGCLWHEKLGHLKVAATLEE